jgi:ubiquinone/menaquinone biosynthesis C-methylase UbiE
MGVIEETFDSYANPYEEKFNRNPIGQYQRRLVQAELSAYLEGLTTILDIGCGPGSDFGFYKSKGLQVEAIDISEGMAEVARKRAKELKLEANITVTSLLNFRPEKRFDLIIMNFGVINAIEDKAGALQRLKEILSENGTLFIVSMPPMHMFSIMQSLASLRLRSAYKRLVKREAVLHNGFKILYYNGRDFAEYFEIIKKVNLCSILPTPDQYQQSSIVRAIANASMKIDEGIGVRAPDFLGGDHICYIMKHKDNIKIDV